MSTRAEADARSNGLYQRLLTAQRIQNADDRIAALYELLMDLGPQDISIRADIKTSLDRITLSQCPVSEASAEKMRKMEGYFL